MKKDFGNNCRNLLFVFIILLNVAKLNAQKIFSLKECVELSFKNNITIKQRELNKRSAEADQLQSKLNLLPNLNGQATNNYNIGFAINPATNTAERDVTFRSNAFGLSSSVILFNGFQNVNSIKQQNATVKANEYDVEATKNNIALTVSNAYMQVLMNLEILQSRNFQKEGTSQQLLRQQKLYEIGSVNRSRYLQLKAQFANEESQVIAAQTTLDQSYLTLWQLMNIEPDTNNDLVKPSETELVNIANENSTAEKIYRDFLAKSPDVLAAKQRTDASRISESIAIGGRSPRLTFSGGLNSFYTTQNRQGIGEPTLLLRPVGIDVVGNPAPYFVPIPSYSQLEIVPFNNQFDRNLGRNFGFTLTVPIFNGWQVNTQVQKSRITKVSSELTQKQAELDLYKTINQAYLDFVSTQKRFEANLNNYEANKESFTMSEAQYNLGAINTAEFVVTKNQYLQSETSLLQSKYELLFRRKVLDFYLGKPLY